MKHLQTITSTPKQALSVIEFDGLVALFGRTLAQVNNAIDFLLTLLGLPDEIQSSKGGS